MMYKLLIPVSAFLIILAACKNDPAAGGSGSTSTAVVADSLSKAAKADTPYMPLMSQEFEDRVVAHKNIPIIDVRPPAEYKTGHLYKAINWPYDTSAAFIARFESLDRRAPVALYCQNGYYSGRAASQLLRRGFRKIYFMKGGMIQWISDGKVLSLD